MNEYHSFHECYQVLEIQKPVDDNKIHNIQTSKLCEELRFLGKHTWLLSL
jgi:hypothetical protein